MEEIRSLVTRAASADDETVRLDAFGELVRRFQDMVFGYAYSVLGDFHLAEDAAQEAFVLAFRQIAQLREADAFAPWLRRIVRTACNRLTRRKQVATTPLDAEAPVPANDVAPDEVAEKTEMRDRVLNAIRLLPEAERAATTLYYINGYSHRDIADFLEVPETTVNNRLHASRKRLKERMLGMVRETLHENAPDERFSRKVIDGLLARPKPLEIEGHPIRQVLDIVWGLLSDYERVDTEETLPKTAFTMIHGDLPVYHLDDTRILRPDTTCTMIQTMAGRTPPVRLLDAGRTFRPIPQDDATHSHAFHQLGVLRVEAGVNCDDMKDGVETVLNAVLGSVGIAFENRDASFYDSPQAVLVKRDEGGLYIADCGMLTPETLRKAGYNPDDVSGYSLCVGLDRLAMLRFGIDDIRDLWRPPHVNA